MSISSELHNFLRPRVIHEASLDVLTELCDLLNGFLAPFSPSVDAPESIDVYVAVRDAPRCILEDAQHRLSFRVQTFIRSEIQNYVPTPSDLDYPNILQRGLILTAAYRFPR